ncbi:EF-hand domain-containing protein [Sphingomonas daechungensis]|uniref:EF-hand domain-containing protein n=1 Tax=Sphingomonas daechungensis TaxID=1176646 RepID=UPI003784B1C9
MFRVLTLALGLSAAAVSSAQAPQPTTRADLQKKIDQNFDVGDKNNDGFLSRAEIQGVAGKAAEPIVAKMEQEFAQMDRDKNGQVSLAEFKAAAMAKLAGNAQATLDKFDRNKDGKVSQAEFRTPFMANFDRADLNKDGLVSADEARKATGGK